MVCAIVLLGAFNSDHIADAFHHANNILLAQRIGTNGTNVCVSHIATTLAEFDLRSHFGNDFAEMSYIAGVLFE